MGEYGELSKSGQVNSTNGNALYWNRATRRVTSAAFLATIVILVTWLSVGENGQGGPQTAEDG
jgi:hypothetical protein